MGNVSRIARKELAAFFSSPAAFIFLGAFLAISLFVFFWVERFFARNIADVRPLFEWMPVLLIFLVAALTMRMWSEERRMGTLELLLTAPVSTLQSVAGKFLACMWLVGIALLLTLPVPVTVSLLGPLDWGPVFGAYLATLFLAGAYSAIGLFVSARGDNQIVSLIVTVLICGLFYLVGSDALTNLFGNRAGEFLKLIGSGSRFESITRGVIDLRDIYYYLSVIGVFLSLNVYAIERLRWASDSARGSHGRWKVAVVLLAANFLAGNFWLQQVGWLRADVTRGQIFSVSDATRGYLQQLQEPLLIRGYFSAQTHPLLAPLVPTLRDLIREYGVAGGGKVRVEFIDPLDDPELEREAGQKFGIKPVAFQTASKYQASLVNSYFDVLIQYGDQYETLGFRDLIDIQARSETDVDVALRNPEYDITRSIKKVLYGYQGSGDLFVNIKNPVVFRGYISGEEQLPEILTEMRQELDKVLGEMAAASNGRLSVQIENPSQDPQLAKRLEEEFGFRPMAVGLLDPATFWFYMTLESGGETVQVPLPENLDAGGLQRVMEAALKRFSAGFLKTVALYTPSGRAVGQGLRMASAGQFRLLEDALKETHSVKATDLSGGTVPEEADLLLVVAPETLDDQQVFAVDQFLMKGGTVILSTSPYNISIGEALAANEHDSGLAAWLDHHGIKIGPGMVLDPNNTPFPVPTRRNIGGFTVQEIQMVAYPYFVDVRGDGLNPENTITAGLGQLTMNWASPLAVDADKNKARNVIRLLQSSAQSWVSDATAIQPDFRRNGPLGFPAGDETGRQLLAAVVEGRFQSWFKGKPSPLVEPPEDDAPGNDQDNGEEPAQEEDPVIDRVIEKSPDSARIIVFASNVFLTDTAMDLATSSTRTRYLNPVQAIQNAIDWSLEDRGLLNIRSRGHFARTLPPLDRDSQMLWEYLNYGLALIGLVIVWAFYRRSRRRAQTRYREILNVGRA